MQDAIQGPGRRAKPEQDGAAGRALRTFLCGAIATGMCLHAAAAAMALLLGAAMLSIALANETAWWVVSALLAVLLVAGGFLLQALHRAR